jgi:hypothetical protein
VRTMAGRRVGCAESGLIFAHRGGSTELVNTCRLIGTDRTTSYLDPISFWVGDPAKLSEIVAFAFGSTVAFVYQTENPDSTPRISSEKRASRARSPDMAQ